MVDPLVAAHDAVVHFAAESHNDNSLDDPGPFIQTNLVGTFTLLEAVPPARRPAAPRLHRRGVRRPRARRPRSASPRTRRTTRAAPTPPPRPAPTTWSAPGCAASGVRATISNCSNNYGPWQHIEKFIPRQITNVIDGGRPRVYGTGLNVRDWIHVEDHSSAVLRDPRARPDRRDLPDRRRRRAQQPRRGADDPRALRARPPTTTTWSPTGPATTCATRSTPPSCASELGWQPALADFEAGLADTIEWYQAHESWWRPSKQDVEATYAAKGQ